MKNELAKNFHRAMAIACMLLPVAASAQSIATFPSKTIVLVIPFTSGSGSDLIARTIAPRLSARWGQAVIVDNKPGASGNLGTSYVAKSAPDGHTLLMTTDTFTMTPAIYKNMPYDPTKDFSPVVSLAEASYALAVNPRVPAKDLQSFIAYVKKNPGTRNYGSPGSGTPHHLAMEMFKSKSGLDILHVPYKGISGALTDLMGNQVQLMFGTVTSLAPYANSGKLKLLAVTGASRSPIAPEVATFREQGMDAISAGNAYYFVAVPARTPPELVARLNSDISAVMNTDDVKSELLKQGLTVKTGSSTQLTSDIKNDLLRWRKVVSDAGITAD